jgi:hypothetical protein
MGRTTAAARPPSSSDSRRQIRSRCRPLSLRNISIVAPYHTAGQLLPASRVARTSASASHIGREALRISSVCRLIACPCHLTRPVGTNDCGHHRPLSLRYPRKISFVDWLALVVIAWTQRMLAQEGEFASPGRRKCRNRRQVRYLLGGAADPVSKYLAVCEGLEENVHARSLLPPGSLPSSRGTVPPCSGNFPRSHTVTAYFRSLVYSGSR